MRTIIWKLNMFGQRWGGLIAILGVPASLGIFKMPSWLSLDATLYSNFRYLAYIGFGIAFLFALWWILPKLFRFALKTFCKRLKSIGDLGDHICIDVNLRKEARSKAPILVIDDRESKAVKVKVKEIGYYSVSAKQEVPADDVITEYPILLVDVNGVGSKRGSNGLEIALGIKKDHPLLQIIIISACINEFCDAKMVNRAYTELDGVFTKGSSYDKDLKPLIDKCLFKILDPIKVWQQTRQYLLSQNIHLGKLAWFENEYVDAVLRIYNKKCELPLNWINEMLQVVGDELSRQLRALGTMEILKDDEKGKSNKRK